jgi:hypothetical protein
MSAESVRGLKLLVYEALATSAIVAWVRRDDGLQEAEFSREALGYLCMRP